MNDKIIVLIGMRDALKLIKVQFCTFWNATLIRTLIGASTPTQHFLWAFLLGFIYIISGGHGKTSPYSWH